MFVYPAPIHIKLPEESGSLTLRSRFKNYEETFVILHPLLRLKPESNPLFVEINHPNKKVLEQNTKKIDWSEMIQKIGFSDISEIDRVLAFIYGARNAASKDEAQKSKTLINEPGLCFESSIDEFPKILTNNILEALKALRFNELLIYSDTDFPDQAKKYSVDELIQSPLAVPGTHQRILTADGAVFFVTDFDQRSTYLSSSRAVIEQIVKLADLEGFFCDENTTDQWSYVELPDDRKVSRYGPWNQ